MKFRISKVLLLISCLAFVVAAGCKKADVKPAAGLQVVTTLFPLYDFARTIGGDKAQIGVEIVQAEAPLGRLPQRIVPGFHPPATRAQAPDA